jgi:hypothetical protein
MNLPEIRFLKARRRNKREGIEEEREKRYIKRPTKESGKGRDLEQRLS